MEFNLLLNFYDKDSSNDTYCNLSEKKITWFCSIVVIYDRKMGKEIFEISNRLLIRNLLNKYIVQETNNSITYYIHLFKYFVARVSFKFQCLSNHRTTTIQTTDLSKKFLRFEEANVSSLPLISSSKSRLIRNPIYRSNYTQVLVLEISLSWYFRAATRMKRSEWRGRGGGGKNRRDIGSARGYLNAPPANNVPPSPFYRNIDPRSTHGPVTRYNLEDDSASKHGYSRIILAYTGGGSFAGEREIGHEDSIRSGWGGDPEPVSRWIARCSALSLPPNEIAPCYERYRALVPTDEETSDKGRGARGQSRNGTGWNGSRGNVFDHITLESVQFGSSSSFSRNSKFNRFRHYFVTWVDLYCRIL